MALADILNKPSIAKILKDKEIVEPDIYDYARAEKKSSYLAYLIRNLGSKILKINRNYDILPVEYSPSKEMHKGDVIKLKRYDSLEDALEDNATPERLFVDALNKVEYGKHYIGLEWQGISKTSAQFRIIPFSEIYQAEIIFMNQNKDEQIVVKSYTDTRYAVKQGGQVVAWVPSVSKEELERYRIRYSHVPLILKKERKPSFNWFNLTSDHMCGEQTYYPLHYGRILRRDILRKGDEKFFDAHEISGYWETIKFFKYRHEKLRIIENPFFFLSEYAFNLMSRMRTQIIKEYEGSNGKIKLKMLNDKEISVLFGDQLAKERELLERRKESNVGRQIYEKFFKPDNLNFAIYS